MPIRSTRIQRKPKNTKLKTALINKSDNVESPTLATLLLRARGSYNQIEIESKAVRRSIHFLTVFLWWCSSRRHANAQQAGITHTVLCPEAWWRTHINKFPSMEQSWSSHKGGIVVALGEKHVALTIPVLTPAPLISYTGVGWEGQDDF